jgi:hypothetical protein
MQALGCPKEASGGDYLEEGSSKRDVQNFSIRALQCNVSAFNRQ